MSMAPLQKCARRAQDWLHDACFDLWADRGVVAGGFREALDLVHNPIVSDLARVRVQARQTYMFSMAKQMGWAPARADDLIALGLATLKGACRTEHGLFVREIDLAAGMPQSQIADLYDTAFALLAMAAAKEAGHRSETLMSETVAAIELHMNAPFGGYLEALPAGKHRLQNPHMHLFEAYLQAFMATGGAAYLDRAKSLYDLCLDRFIDHETGTLGEAFLRSDWSVPEGEAGEIVEPGHQFEWVWLFERYRRLAGTGLPPEAGRLYRFACRSVDAMGRTVQAVTRQGGVHDGSARTWPQTEALKAHLAMMRMGDELAGERAVQSFNVLMNDYLTAQGGWKDHFGADGTLLSTQMPASTGYHVVLALADLIETAGA